MALMYARTYGRVPYNRSAKARKPAVKDAAQYPIVMELASLKEQIPARSVDFARSLVENFNKYGRLSDRQMSFVHAIIEGIRNPPKEQAPETMEVSAERIVKMFELAQQKLKRARIVLRDSTGQRVQFWVAGPNSKYAGQVMVSDGGAFGASKFFGRIETNGQFVMTKLTTDAVKQLVIDFAANPEDIASKYGKYTGECCFCCKGLNDKRSLAVGYGPVCATRFGLAWGSV